MKNSFIILGIASILLLSGCLDNAKTDLNVNEENVSVDKTATNSTDTNNSSASGNTYLVGSNITEDGKEVVS